MTQAKVELARRIAERLGEIEGIVAVALGGSWARGETHPGSDVDLGIYYRNEHRPSIEELHRLAQGLGYRNPREPVTDFGGWGPWINGGAWLQVEGTPVDWLYRELGQVSRVIDECRGGRFAVHYQLGHPHGFHTHIYMGEVHYCRPLHDPEGVLGSLKNATRDYPSRLKLAVVRNQLWEARFALDTCRSSAARGDAFYVAGCLFRCAACMVQALFALNERYLINEKGSVERRTPFPCVPRTSERPSTPCSREPAEARKSWRAASGASKTFSLPLRSCTPDPCVNRTDNKSQESLAYRSSCSRRWRSMRRAASRTSCG